MNKGDTYSKIIKDSFASGNAFLWATALLGFLLPLIKAGIVIPIVLLVVVWILSPKQYFRINLKPVLVFSSLYLFHLIAMAYTENVPRGLNDLEQKISLILFPVLFGSVRPFSRKEIFLLLVFFTTGTVISVLVSFGTSAVSFQQSGNFRDFYMSAFAPEHHPSYIAMYMNLAIAFLIFTILGHPFNLQRKTFLWIVVFFLALSLIFPASKMGFLCFLILVIYTLVYAYSRRVLKNMNTIILLFLTVIFVAYVNFDPISKMRVESALEDTMQDEMVLSEASKSGTEMRVLAWNIALEEIAKNPGGVGTGDINDVLVRRYERDGLNDMVSIGMNPHNNFMQIALAQGVIPMFFFVFSLFFPLRRIVANKDWLYGFFLVIIVMNFLVESMLEKQSGVIFFAFFNALFFFASYKSQPTKV